MKKITLSGLLIVIINIISIVFMIYVSLANNLGARNNIYTIIGTIITLFLTYFIIKNNKFGFLGMMIWYGIQIIGTQHIMHNYRYGLTIRLKGSFEFLFIDTNFDYNLTALILFILSIIGWFELKRRSKIRK